MNLRTLIVLVALVSFCGCAVFQSQDAPGSTRLETEPDNRGQYWVYVPSTHNLSGGTMDWPLVVTCHGSLPLDSAEAQIREWRALAERGAFIVVAPVLSSTALPQPKPGDQIRKQVDDERLILAIVNRMLLQYQLDPQKVYLTGYGTGNYAVLWAGLRNPKVFRAICSRTGNFDPNLVNQPMLLERLDVYQPVEVIYAERDPRGMEGQAEGAWLKEQGWQTMVITPIGGGATRHPGMAWEFFAGIPRHEPLLRPVITPERDKPLARRLRFTSDRPMEAVYWKLGDGTESRERDFVHVFPAPGVYDGLLVARPEKAAAIHRKFQVRLEK